MRIVKNFLRFFHIFLIIFLTGCAAQRYHTTTDTGRTPTAFMPALGWPLDGRVLTRFGGREDGVTMKGIVIQGAEGQDVRAAAEGNVVYVDDSLRGYGKAAVIEHDGRVSTVYARVSQILVKVGERVRKGQTIARVGRAGKGADPQLYFELRQDARPVDPEPALE
jgi:septal ring factor EnvC (AmiA/AmiB activator)